MAHCMVQALPWLLYILIYPVTEGVQGDVLLETQEHFQLAERKISSGVSNGRPVFPSLILLEVPLSWTDAPLLKVSMVYLPVRSLIFFAVSTSVVSK